MRLCINNEICGRNAAYENGWLKGMCHGCYDRHRGKTNPVSKRRAQRSFATKLPEYSVLSGMKARCYDRNSEMYPSYGGRGIAVCGRWLEEGTGFSNFLTDMGPRPSSEHSIDRIDNNGDYSPENCRWATNHEQFRNVQSNRWIEWRGNSMILTDWLREIKAYTVSGNLAYWRFNSLVSSGMTEQQALQRLYEEGPDFA